MVTLVGDADLSAGYEGLDDFGTTKVVLIVNSFRSFVHVTSSGSGRTRVSAVAVMKLVSPLHRGRKCMWM